jgi:hypothetical protein
MKTQLSVIILILGMFSSAMSEEQKEVAEAKVYISRLQRGGTLYSGDAPSIGVLQEWNIAVVSVNTSIPEAELKALYNQACEKIEVLWGKKLLSYRFDKGYGSQYAVLNFPDSDEHIKQILVALVRGNDSTSFSFTTNTKPFDYSLIFTPLDHWNLDAKPMKQNKSE